MTKQNSTEDRDEVLFAFHRACTRPTAEQVVEWIDRYPQFAHDIRAHAAVARDWDEQSNCAVQPEESVIASAYSRALNLMFEASEASKLVGESFQEIIAARGSTVPQLARAINIDRTIVADLVSGRMKEPIKNVFVDAVDTVLNIPRNKFFSALRNALDNPTLGFAKASSAPTSIARTYEEIIRSSDELDDEQRRYWLEES